MRFENFQKKKKKKCKSHNRKCKKGNRLSRNRTRNRFKKLSDKSKISKLQIKPR